MTGMTVQIRKKKKKKQCSINVLENSVYIWKKNEIKYLLHTPHKKKKKTNSSMDKTPKCEWLIII